MKCVDLHPNEPWLLASLYNGNVHVWNHESQTLIKSFEVTDLPGKNCFLYLFAFAYFLWGGFQECISSLELEQGSYN